MTDKSARFALPFILPGQAQKEAYHNEAFALVDAALHPAVATGPTATVPPDPGEGECWIVAAGAGGPWSGRTGSIACWTGGGWRFVDPVPGMCAWNIDLGCWLHWSGVAWSDGAMPAARFTIAGQQVVGPRLPEVPSPSGGTIIDAEARAAVDAVIATLKSHGLTD